MADPYDRGYYKKRPYVPKFQEREREREQEPDSSQQQIKPVVILAKHPDRAASSTAPPQAGGDASSADSSKTTVLLSKASSRAGSPASSSSASKDDSQASAPSSTNVSAKQPPAESLSDRLAAPPDMAAPVKFVDDSLQWCDNALEYLLDQPDFYVVGIIGMQGAGKSTVMSILAGQYGQSGMRQLFRPQSRELRELGQHCTTGVDIYVTPERMVLLDTQPVLSASVMDHMIQFEKKTPGGGDFHSLENAHVMQSLQMASFLMAVCHTVIVVQDWFTDPNFLRFVLTAEMLKPTTSSHDQSRSSSEDVAESFPHLVFVQNKCTPGDFSPENVAAMSRMLDSVFAKSKLKYKGLISMDPSVALSKENKHQGPNLFLLPKRLSELEEKRRIEGEAVPGYEDGGRLEQLASMLTLQVGSMPRQHITHTPLTEKNWFHYSARLWDAMQKSMVFMEYSRLLP
ncbi:nonsense-mediated mRNA decay factor SMG9 isoform X1 [Amblyomma americanum]